MLRAVLIGLMVIGMFGADGEIEAGLTPLEDSSARRLDIFYSNGMQQFRQQTPINASEMSKYDFAPLFMSVDNCGLLGYIGDDFWRLHITFDEIKKIAPLKYSAKGKTMTKGNYCDFEGEITIDQVYRSKEIDELDERYGVIDQGIVFAEVVLRENDKQKGSGIFKGDLMTGWYIDTDENLQYDIDESSDHSANNMFLGVWTSYKTGAQKRAAWGQYRIPMSGDLDIGACCFSVDKKYGKNGWGGSGESYCKSSVWRKK